MMKRVFLTMTGDAINTFPVANNTTVNIRVIPRFICRAHYHAQMSFNVLNGNKRSTEIDEKDMM